MIEPKRYKCHTCHVVLYSNEMIGDRCPTCHEPCLPMCSKDNCDCSHDIIESIAYCPDCGEPVCPLCGCHDVVQISRVTGYLQEVGGWNAGKQQELKDRTRYDVA